MCAIKYLGELLNKITSNPWIITILIFLLGLIAQYLINRSREIKRLMSYQYTIIKIIEELMEHSSRQEANFKEFAKKFLAIEAFSNPLLRFMPSRSHLIDTIDKKDLMYLIIRWGINGNTQITHLIDLLKISHNLTMETDYAKQMYEKDLYSELNEYLINWNSKMELFNNFKLVLEVDWVYFGFDEPDRMFIINKIHKYALSDNKQSIKDFIEIIVQPILSNTEFKNKHSTNSSVGFREFWLLINQIMILYKMYKNTKAKYFSFFNGSKRNMKKYTVKLNSIKEGIQNISIKESYV